MSEAGQKIIDATRAAAEARPGHVHTGSCVYVNNGAPSCLIGNGLWALGLIDAETENLGINELDVEAALVGLNVKVDRDELVWLEEAQEAQDGRNTWGRAVEHADGRRKDYLA